MQTQITSPAHMATPSNISMNITIALGSKSYNDEAKTALQYADQLVELGHTVSLTAPPAPIEKIGRFRRVFASPPPVEPTVEQFTQLPFIHTTEDNVSNELPTADILLATSCNSANWIAPLGQSKGVPVHFALSYQLDDGNLTPYIPSAYQLPMQTLTVSHWLAQLVTLRHNAQVDDIVPLGIEVSDVDVRKQPLRPTVGLCVSEEIELDFSGVSTALCRLREKLPSLQLVVYGNPELVSPGQLPSDTMFVRPGGEISLQQAQAACDAWVYYHPSKPFATEVVQALAVGTPVVATTTGDAQVILANGGGLLVPINNASALNLALHEICTLDAASWRQASNLAIDLAKQYSWPAIGRKLHFALTHCYEQHQSMV